MRRIMSKTPYEPASSKVVGDYFLGLVKGRAQMFAIPVDYRVISCDLSS